MSDRYETTSSVEYAIQFDPYEVLAVSPLATLMEIRDAYRSKSKKHHPDSGGDAWAFRVLTRSYEVLSTARVMGRASEEMARETASTRPADEPRTGAAEAYSPGTFEEGRLRSGVSDQAIDPSLRADVELLLLRFEMDDPSELLSSAARQRNLSCNLNIIWPPADVGTTLAQAQKMLPALESAVAASVKHVKPTSHKTCAQGGQFQAWLSFSSAVEADRAFQALRSSLRTHGLGVTQKIREVMIPRDWHA